MYFVPCRKHDAHGILAQLGEHLPYKQRVIGSSPIGPIYGEVAQLARARGSYPRCRGFKSPLRYLGVSIGSLETHQFGIGGLFFYKAKICVASYGNRKYNILMMSGKVP